MLVNGSKLIGTPILSLHTGGTLARVSTNIVDPNDLRVMAFRLDGELLSGEYGDILQSMKVREFSRMGMIIDSIDDLVKREEVVRLDEIMSLNFSLLGLKVETKKGTKLGRVVDFVVTTDDFLVMQLVVKRPAIKALVDPELIIGRSQITEVTDDKIIVKDEEAKIRKELRQKDFVPNFVNPFREPNFAPTHNQSPDELDTE